ncbi:MAG: hypothetical protein K6A89_04675 [Treponema sp.]|nr:hypothetical protein [Treponema sp.]
MERIKSFRTFFRIFAFFIFAFAFSVNSFAAGKKKTKKSDKNAYVFYDENSEATDIEEMEVDKISGQKQTEIQNEIVQPFAWENAGDVLYYEILIEKFNDESEQWEEYIYHETDEEETEECVIYLNPILSPGKYRSTIKIYNILGVLEEEMTQVAEFPVLQAFKPEIRNVTYSLYMRPLIYLDDIDNDGIIEIEGQNLFMPQTDNQYEAYTEYYLQGRAFKIRPTEIISHDDRNRKLTFQFDMRTLDVGNYHFVAKDASGLHSDINTASELTVKFKKVVDLDVSAGYLCPVILHDDTLPTYMGSRVWPLSAQARISFMFFKRSWGYFGAGVKATATMMKHKFEYYSIDGNLFSGYGMFVYQLPMFKRRVLLDLHIGPGVTFYNNFVFHFSNNLDSPPLNTLSISANAGFSAQIYINKRLFIEPGCDYQVTFNSDSNLGIIGPFVGVGWQF